ncbi:pentapeptide repeat-containing protein [Streptomyces sp. DT190]|uniref:pentapeptide repeat-containing protein n=1 Tax=unclassified Streptomyces TaxID=2593676 RepID=UPI003CF365BD
MRVVLPASHRSEEGAELCTVPLRLNGLGHGTHGTTADEGTEGGRLPRLPMSINWKPGIMIDRKIFCEKCRGRRIGDTPHCLEHASEADFRSYLLSLPPHANLDLRATKIDADRFGEIKRHLNNEMGVIRFDDARFTGKADFFHVSCERAYYCRTHFLGLADFRHANVERIADFSDAQFIGEAQFGDATLNRAKFTGAQFSELASFDDTVFQGPPGSTRFDFTYFSRGVEFARVKFFQGVTFKKSLLIGTISFGDVKFYGEVNFTGAHFGDDVWFTGSTKFSHSASFEDAVFPAGAVFERVVFASDVIFASARFGDDVWLWPIAVAGSAVFRGAIFEGRALLDVAASEVWFDRSRFVLGGRARLRYAHVSLESATFAQPMLIAAVSETFRSPYIPDALLDEGEVEEKARQALGETDGSIVKLVSSRGIDGENLTISGLDLSVCLFASAHRLDGLRIEGCEFMRTPSTGSKKLYGKLWRWSSRQVLVEESHWRASQRLRNGWRTIEQHPPLTTAFPGGVSPRPVEEQSPETIAATYRALRKSEEDNKNEPGAADFYYGEMEMRRHADSTNFGERCILYAYWVISGYALRAWRVVVTLIAFVFVIALPLQHFGFAGKCLSYPETALYAMHSAIYLTSMDSIELTAWGQLMRISIRVAVPLLIALALLSIRNRVKR